MPQPIPGPYPFATATLSGIVSAAAQTFGGNKIFNANVTVQGTLVAAVLDLTSVTNLTGTLVLTGSPTTSGTAVAAVINAANALTTTGDKILSVRNNNVEKASITKDGLLNALGLTLASGGGGFITFQDGSTQHTAASGSGGSGFVFDVTKAPYNADPTGATNSAPAIQAAVDAACALVSAGGPDLRGATVFFPEGKYLIQHPIHIWTTNITLLGAGHASTYVFRDNTYNGSAFVLSNRGTQDLAPIPVVSPLLTPYSGSSHAFFPNQNRLTQGPNEYNLECFSYGGNGILNGLSGGNPDPWQNGFLTAFTAELTFKPTGDQGGATFTNLFHSQGRRFLEEPGNPGAFMLGIFGQDTSTPVAYGLITTTAGQVTIHGTTIITNETIHHMAITYDGTTVRLFLDGNLENSAPLTGKVVAAPWEDLKIGYVGATWPAGGSNPLYFTTNAIIDSPRISYIARYTSNFTPPTAQFTPDGFTIWLTNFEMQGFGTLAQPIFCKIYYSTFGIGLSVALPMMRRYQQSPGLFGNVIKGFSLGGAGIEMQCVNNWQIEDIFQEGGGVGIVALNNCFVGYAQNMYFLSQQYCGILNNEATGLTNYNNWQFTGGTPIAGLGFACKNTYFQYNNPTFLGNGDPSTDGGIASFENAVWADEGHTGSQSPLIIRDAGCAGAQFKYCTFEKAFAGNSQSVIVVSGPANQLNFDNCIFNGGTGTPSIFDIKQQQGTSPLVGPSYIQINGAARWDFGAPDPAVPLILPSQSTLVRLIDTFKDTSVRSFYLPDYDIQPSSTTTVPADKLQAIFDSVPAAGAVIEFPMGDFWLEKPILVTKSGTKIRGKGSNVTHLGTSANIGGSSKLFAGAAFLFCANTDAEKMILGTSLVSGPGHSVIVNPAASVPRFANLSDCPGGDLNKTPGNGDGSLTVEYFFEIDLDDTSPVGDPRNILSSIGSGPNTTQGGGVFGSTVTVDGGGNYNLTFTLSLNGIAYHAVHPTFVTKNVVHHLAISFDHTSGVGTGYLDGVGVHITTQSGQFPSQEPYESVYLGDEVPGFPFNGAPIISSIKGKLDGIRFSRINRYPSNFTPPTAKFTLDTDCVLLLNFDEFYGPTFVGSGWQLPGLGLPFKYYYVPRISGSGPGSCEISGFHMGGAGGAGIMWAGVQGKIDDIFMEGFGTGIEFYRDSFIGGASRVRLLGGASVGNANGNSTRCGVLCTSATGFYNLTNFIIDGYVTAGIISYRPGFVINNIDLQPETSTHWGMMFYGADDFDDVSVTGVGVDIEQTTTALEGACYLSGVKNARFADTEFGSNRTDSVVVPCIVTTALDSTNLTLQGCAFLPNPTGTLIDQRGTGRSSIVLENCKLIDPTLAHTLSNDITNITAVGGFFGGTGGLMTTGVLSVLFEQKAQVNRPAFDSRPGIQGQINAASQWPSPGPLINNNIVELPPGQLYISKPLLVAGTGPVGLHIRGQGQHSTTITPQVDQYNSPAWKGPLMLWGQVGAWTNFSSPLVGSVGHSLHLTNVLDRVLLSDVDSVHFDGLAQFSLECWINLGTWTDSRVLVSSSGILDSVHSAEAFSLWATNTGTPTLNFDMTIAGVDYHTSTTVTPGVTYHVEGSYDGSNIHFFLNGVLISTAPATGTVTQAFYEDVYIGAEPLFSINYAFRHGTIADTKIDSLRFSNVARHTSGFAPPVAKYTVDANTLFLLNFDTFDSELNLFVGQCFSNGLGVIPNYVRGFQTGFSYTSANSVKMSGISFEGSQHTSGLQINQAVACQFEDLYFHNTSIMAMQVLDVNSFYNFARDITIQSNSTFGCQMAIANGNVDGENLLVQFGVWLADLKGNWDTVKLQPSTNTALPARVQTGGNTYGGGTIKYMNIDAEVALPSNYITAVLATGLNATGPGSLIFDDCFIDSEGPGSHTAPAVMYDQLDYLEFRSCRFRVNANAPAPYVFHRLTAPRSLDKKFSIINCTVDDDFTNAGVAFADHAEDLTFLTPPYNGFATADIRDFGARPWVGPVNVVRPTISNSDAIQKAFDSLPTNLGDIGTPMGAVHIPSGDWPIDRPILMKSGQRLYGDGRSVSNIICGQGTPVTNPTLLPTFAGPMIIMGVGAWTPTYGPDLFGGSGRSLEIVPATGDTYQLNDSTAWSSFTGRTQISLEFKLKMLANTNACWVIGSGGAKLDDGPTNTFQSCIGVETYNLGTPGNQNRLTFKLTTSNGEFPVTPSPELYVIGTPIHVSMNYDGSFFDVYIDGVNVAHLAATGTLVQRPWEASTIGGSGPEVGAQLLLPVALQIQSIRLSNIARHTGTGSFTPPSAPYTTDGNTLALYNWDQGNAVPADAPWIIGQTSAQVAYNGFPVGDLVKHYVRFNTNFANGQIDNLGILSGGDNAGIVANTSPISLYQNLYIAHTSTYALANYSGAAFYSRMTDIDVFGPYQIGVALTAYSGENVTVTGGRISAWLVAGVFSSINTQPSGSLTEWGIICGGGSFGTFSGIHLTSGSVDTEGSFPNLKAGMLFAGDLQTAYTSACNPQGTTLTGVPCVLIAGLRAAAPAGWTSVDDLFITNSGATGLIEKVSTAVINGQILLIGPNNNGDVVPWTSTLTGQILVPATSILA